MEQSKPNRKVLKTIRPQKKPELEIEICLVTEENMNEVGYACTKIFNESEPVCGAMEVETDDLFKYLHLPILQKSMKDGLAIAAYNKANNEFVATIWSEDPIEQDPIPEDYPPVMLEPFYFMEYLEHEAFKLINGPKQKGEMVHVVIIGTNPKYTGLDIMREMLQFQMYEQDISRTANLYFAEATNDFSIRVFEKNGYKSILTCAYDDLKDNPKFEKIQNANKKMKERGLTYGKCCEFMVWERNKHAKL